MAPPARPVAITGWPRRLITRATLIPLPPGIVTWSMLRCRRPCVKLGTSRVLSSAGFSVTVMITCATSIAARSAARSAFRLGLSCWIVAMETPVLAAIPDSVLPALTL